MYVCMYVRVVYIHVVYAPFLSIIIAVDIVMPHRLCEQYMNNTYILFMIVLNLFVLLCCVCTSGL